MREGKILKTKYLLFLAFLCPAFLFCFAVRAEKLPLKNYSSADGLASDVVNKIVADSRGFLWFCTADGISRFDGYKFKNYTQEQGLPHRSIDDFLETKDGDYLMATSNGLAVFNPNGKAYRWNFIKNELEQNSSEPPLFKTYIPPNDPNLTGSKNIVSFAQDGNGNIYVSTRYNLYRFVKTSTDWQFQKVEFAQSSNEKTDISGILFTDSGGDLWFAMAYFIYRISKNGEIEKISEPGGNGFFEDRDRNIWINSGGHDLGIRVFSIQNNKPVQKNLYTKKDGLFMNSFSNAIAQDVEGKLFIVSGGKLFKFIPNAKENELKFRPLENEEITTAVSKEQSIWFSFQAKGVARYSSNSFYTFDEKDGFLKYSIGTIFGNKNGEVFLSFGKTQIVRIKDEKIENVEIIDSKGRYWIGGFYDLQSQDGEFWLSTINGLFRFPKTPDFKDLARIKPKKIYTTADGFYSNEAVAIFEDSRGDIWISATTPENSLLRWEKSTEKIHRYTFDYGLPKGSGAISFGEDAAGNIWIGFYFGQIIRYKDGKFRDFTVEGLIQRNFVTKFLSDDKGRLWFSTSSRGLFRVENPNDETPVFTNFSTANGLSSNQTNCLTKDKLGRIYVTTGKGINRIEPDTERIKIFTQNDGLPSNLIQMCYADVNGNLWFSSVSSLIKYTPTAEKPSAPPPILIDQISINGKPQPVSELGEKEIKNLQFNSDERQIQIGFFAISFEAGETLRYQYKLNNQDWSAPSDQRSVSFDLAAGSYEFAVRAINSDGAVSEKTAVASFKILPPIWQRWWFLLLTFLFVAGAVFALDRYRVAKTRQVEAALEALRKSREERFAELQRVRTRIATDLHDDIGSSLTQIAVLTEVARGQASFLEAENLSTPLERIKNVSKELVAVMSDVVWAINPQKDFLQDLVQRMRRFASDVFTTRGIKFEFIVPEIEENLSLGANIRREVFAIFKESVNNAVKYSECTQARAEFRIEENNLTLKISDNGKGFDTKTVLSDDFKPEMGGNGLINIRRRAAELGGNCEISSEIGKGTIINLSVPLQF